MRILEWNSSSDRWRFGLFFFFFFFFFFFLEIFFFFFFFFLRGFGLFARVCELAAFHPFVSAEQALDNILQLSEGQATPLLLDLLKTSLPKDATLGVGEERLAVSIQV
jgi:hypothetical protein